MITISAELCFLKDCGCSVALQHHFHDFFLIGFPKIVAATASSPPFLFSYLSSCEERRLTFPKIHTQEHIAQDRRKKNWAAAWLCGRAELIQHWQLLFQSF